MVSGLHRASYCPESDPYRCHVLHLERPQGPTRRGAVNHPVRPPRFMNYPTTRGGGGRSSAARPFLPPRTYAHVRPALAPRKWRQPCRKRTTQPFPRRRHSHHSPRPRRLWFADKRRSISILGRTGFGGKEALARLHLHPSKACKILSIDEDELLSAAASCRCCRKNVTTGTDRYQTTSIAWLGHLGLVWNALNF